MSATVTVNRNYDFWKKTLDFLVEHATEIIVWMREDDDGEVTSVVLMFVNKPQRIMVHVYLDLIFFDAAQISRGFQILAEASSLYQTNLSFTDVGYVAPYVDFDWHPHTTEDVISINILANLYPTLPAKLITALSKITDKVYYKNSPQIPLVICKQFPNQRAALKVFVGGL